MTKGETIKLDTLIIGGGIQGLWLLKDLSSKGYSTLLLTKGSLGDGQTLHSQLRVQGGHSVANDDRNLIVSCRDVSHGLWSNFLEQHPDVRAMGDSKILFRWNKYDSDSKETTSSSWKSFCKNNDLIFFDQHTDESINLGLIQREDEEGNSLLFSSDETWLDGRALILALIEDVSDYIRQGLAKIIQGTANRIDVDEAGNVRVLAQINDREYEVEPKTLVLAAGSGNVHILSQITFYANEALQNWKSFLNILKAQDSLNTYNVIVLRGNLPNLTGFFKLEKEKEKEKGSEIKLNIFSRRDKNDQIVWLLPIQDDNDYKKITQKKIKDLRSFLQQLNSPDILPDRFQWGVYRGDRVKIEVADSTAQVVARRGNLWVFWPNWLTLAPLASEQITDEINNFIESPDPNCNLSNLNFEPYSEVADEKWQTVDWQNWSDFREIWEINDENNI